MTLSPPGLAEPLDVASLYRTLSGRLKLVVRYELRLPEEVVEDACQFAWGQLLHQAQWIAGEAVFTWLVRTAQREALKLAQRERRQRELSEPLMPTDEEGETGPVALGPEEVLQQRWRIDEIRRLPARQQRVLWLQVLGLSYAEIASTSGCSVRTVERQLLRAKRRLRELERE